MAEEPQYSIESSHTELSPATTRTNEEPATFVRYLKPLVKWVRSGSKATLRDHRRNLSLHAAKRQRYLASQVLV
jgi:hypothetical protein